MRTVTLTANVPQKTDSSFQSWTNALWLAILAVFFLGVILRVIALDLPIGSSPFTRWQPQDAPYLERDEMKYIALVEQLDAGRGYTLQGHPILGQLRGKQNDRPLFFHPPGGIAFFWFTYRIAGNAGFALAQVLSFVIFFWSILLLGRLVLEPIHWIAILTLSVLAIFTPIMTHVSGRFWLDGPLLAFSTAATAMALLGIRRKCAPLVCLAGVLLGYASLIKLTAFLVIPGVAALVRAVMPRDRDRGVVALGLLFVAIAGLIQLPWEIWQWRVVGSAFPTWPGRPDEQLVRANAYVHYLTVVRPPWIYLELLPQVNWTLVPSLVLLGAQCRNRVLRERGVALTFWIVVVIGFHIALGAIGYSKVLRYVILCTPATVILFALVVGGVVQTIRKSVWLPYGKGVTIALMLFAAMGLGLEVAQGLETSMVDNRRMDLIKPILVLHWIID